MTYISNKVRWWRMNTTKTATIDGKEFTIQNIIPSFKNDTEKSKIQKYIEKILYDIFKKYW